MAETLLDIVQTACGELVLQVPTSVMVPSDQFATDMLYMAQQAGRELVRNYEWGSLITLALLPTVASKSDYDLPADYYRMVNDTQWDRSTNWRTSGPLTPQADRFLSESQLGLATTYRQFRLLGNKSIRINPTPPDASGLIVYEYVSKNWVVRSGGLTSTAFAADTDTTIFDFDLMVKECKWRWMFAKGQDAAEFRQERDDALMLLQAADQGGTVLNMGGIYDDEGGNVFAGTSPNFRLSDGSGNNLIVDGAGVGSIDTAALTALLATLPTTLPGSSGVLWNNGGVIQLS